MKKAISSLLLPGLASLLAFTPHSASAQAFNEVLGTGALQSNTTGSYNVALGDYTLFANTTGTSNTANGTGALFYNTTGNGNTASGMTALLYNTTGNENTASGTSALYYNTTGYSNTASGVRALYQNTEGYYNTASGFRSLFSNHTGIHNAAFGVNALWANSTGTSNTASGNYALYSNSTGSGNIALGYGGGADLTTGSNNIDIGNPGVAGESNTIRIGLAGLNGSTYVAGIYGSVATNGGPVYVNSDGRLGTGPSSRRFKKDIADMGTASEALLALRPVSFHYKEEFDNKCIPQFGLVAEEVAEICPDLVLRDEKGEIYSVRYEAVNAMLLNEFLKEHRKVEQQQATMTKLKSTVAKQEATIAQQQKDIRLAIAQQQKETKALMARLDEQASQIRKVSDQLAAASLSRRTAGGLQVSRLAPKITSNNR